MLALTENVKFYYTLCDSVWGNQSMNLDFSIIISKYFTLDSTMLSLFSAMTYFEDFRSFFDRFALL